MSGSPTAIDRRRVLTGAGVLALLAVAAPACGSTPTTPELDDLEAQRRLAQRDSELAAAAKAAIPDPDAPDSRSLAAALEQVSLERAEHARALATEIARAAGKPAPAELPETSAPAAEPDAAAPAVSQVVNALRDAADSAEKSAASSSGYRAGLLASIAAACTASYAVALVTQ